MGCATSISDSKPSNNNKCGNGTEALMATSDGCDAKSGPFRTVGGCTGRCSTAVVGPGGDQPPIVTSPFTWDDDPYAPREIVLNEQQKRIIVKNWRLLSTDLIGRGSRIFQLIFARNPRVRALFPCGQLEGEELLNDPRFRGHAQRFMQAVGAVVDNLDNYNETLTPLLNDLGRRHVGFKGFKPIYFNDFQESIMQVFADDLGSKFNAPAREAWRLVLLFILTELKRGFTQCLREKGMLSAAERAGNGNQQLQQRTSTVLENDETGNGSAAVVTTNAVHLAATTPSLQPFAAHCVAASSKSGDVMNSVANGREPEGKLAALLAGCKAR